MIDVITPLINGIYAANAAGITRWVGYFYEKQPYRLCQACKVADHFDANFELMKNQRLATEETVHNFGFAETILPQARNPQEEAQLFLQHGSNRRSRLRQPNQIHQRPLDGMRISYFTATDNDYASSSSTVSQYESSSRFPCVMDNNNSQKKRTRQCPTLVIVSESPTTDMAYEPVESQESSSEPNVWDIAVEAYQTQNNTDAWTQVTISSLFSNFNYFNLIIFLFYFLLVLFGIFVMKFFSWNCQGFHNPHTRDYFRFCISQYDHDIFFLSETKTQNNKMHLYLSHTKYPNYWYAPSIGFSGGIAFA